MNKLKREFHILCTSLMFFTRLPLHKVMEYRSEVLGDVCRYFPLAGWITGGVATLTFMGAAYLFPLQLALLLAMVAALLFTGALHEDGFADFCDGYGGGHSPVKILAIMKDSSIGTYGAVGLISLLAVKFIALTFVPVERIPVVLISAHAFSRLVPVWLMFTADYVRNDGTSKTKAVGNHASVTSVAVASLLGLGALALLQWVVALAVLVCSVLVFVGFRAYVIKRTGGYTGDVLGALQQIIETVVYLVIVASVTLMMNSIKM